jgi:hypothetical protein
MRMSEPICASTPMVVVISLSETSAPSIPKTMTISATPFFENIIENNLVNKVPPQR